MVRKLNTTASPFTAKSMRKRRNPLYCHSELKAKRTGHPQPLPHSFGRGLDKLNAGLDKKGTTKTTRKYLNASVAARKKQPRRSRLQYWSHCRCRQNNAIRIEWKRDSKAIKKISTAVLLPENKFRLVRRAIVDNLYMLTEIEATFRSLKRPGLRRFTT